MTKLVGVIVEKLLGEFDHRIEFPESWDYVIIYGPNGVGKTRLLEMIKATLSLNVRSLSTIPFARMFLTFADGHTIEVKQINQKRTARNRSTPTRRVDIRQGRSLDPGFEYEYILSANGSEVERFNMSRADSDSSLIQWLETTTRWTRISSEIWEDRADGEQLTLDDLRERYAGRLLRRPGERPGERPVEIPEVISSFSSKTMCHLIKTQRLVTLPKQSGATSPGRSQPRSRPTVNQYAEDLRAQLNSALAANSRFTQTLDRTFPRRILERSGDQMVGTDDAIRSRYVAQNELREQLSSIGLIDAQPELPLPDKVLADWERYVLATYLDDTDQKLATFQDLLDKVSLLEEIVNSRFLHKKLNVNTDNGLRILKTLDGEPVAPEQLSSGEQHELILFYDLLFNVPKESIVLIDEPEISLHVSWQQRFLFDLSRVALASSLRFVIATHSPQLIHKSWHRTVELGGDSGF